MPDYKSMYYYLSGRMATTLDVLEAALVMTKGCIGVARAALDVLEANINVFSSFAEIIKLDQQIEEQMFINRADVTHTAAGL